MKNRQVFLTSFLLIVIFFNFFDSPKEKKLKTEIQNLTEQYKLIDEKFSTIDIQGLEYNFFLRKWKKSNDFSVNYIISSSKN